MNLSTLTRHGAFALLAMTLAPTAHNAAAAPATYHHVHLNATDPAAAAKWYADNLGGQAKKIGFFSAVGFGKITIIFFQAKPGFEGSVGSAVDHIGFSYKDIEAKLKELAEK